MNHGSSLAGTKAFGAGEDQSTTADRVFVKKRMHKYVLLFFDWLAVNVAYLASLKLHALTGLDLLTDTIPYATGDILFFVAYSGVILLIFQSQGLYKINVYTSILDQGRLILKSILIAVVGLALLGFFTRPTAIVESRLVLVSFVVVGFVVLVIIRIIILRSVFLFVASRGWFPRRVVIVGTGKSAMKLARGVLAENPFGLTIVGFLSDLSAPGTVILDDLKIIGHAKDVEGIVREKKIREVVFALEEQPDDYCLEMLDCAIRSRAQVLVGCGQFSVIPERLHVESYGGVPLFSVGASRPYLGIPGLKRLMDILGALTGLVILSPLFLVLAIAIKLDSRGPVLFRQTRLGLRGRPFTFLKLRSMHNGSDNDPAREAKLRLFIREDIADKAYDTKIVEDHKVTRVGRFIRKLSIDELPQLLNVLRGDMSLVGPRPCLPYEWEHYAEWHKRRLNVMPGCTGVWQVLGRSEVGFRDMVILDLYYTYNVSFHFDIRLILKTIPVMLFGTGGR